MSETPDQNNDALLVTQRRDAHLYAGMSVIVLFAGSYGFQQLVRRDTTRAEIVATTLAVGGLYSFFALNAAYRYWRSSKTSTGTFLGLVSISFVGLSGVYIRDPSRILGLPLIGSMLVFAVSSCVYLVAKLRGKIP
jgi:hypothetical protein